MCVQEYLSAAVAYLEGDETQLNVEDIRGIWVASDDSGVVDRIKEIAPSYLPNVDNSTIFWAAGGVEGGPEIPRVTTRTDKEVQTQERREAERSGRHRQCAKSTTRDTFVIEFHLF